MGKADRYGGLALCAVALAAAGCGGSGGADGADAGKRSAQDYTSDATFTMAITGDPGNQSPLSTSSGNVRFINRFSYDPLVWLDSKGNIVSGLARSWKTTPTSVTYTLQDGITCQDGTVLRPSDVAAVYRFIANPKKGSPLLGLTVPPGLTATADDAKGTVTLKVPKPDGFLLRKTWQVSIVCPKGLKDPRSIRTGAHGTGLYKLVDAAPDDHYTYERRSDYRWGPGGVTSAEPGLPRKVVLKVVKDGTTATNLLLAGQLNGAEVTDPGNQDRLESRDLFRVDMRSPAGELYYNQASGRPGADPALRHALTAGLNLPELGRVLTSGKGIPSVSLVNMDPKPCSGNTVKGNIPGFDAAGAAQALDRAGWVAGAKGVRRKGGKPLKLTFVYSTGEFKEGMASSAELLAEQWRKLGADVTVRALPDTGLQQVVFGGGDWDATFAPLGFTLPDYVAAFLTSPPPPKGLNFASISNPEYDRLAGEAAVLTGAAACEKWNAAEVSLFKQTDVVPFTDANTPIYGSGAEFQYTSSDMLPATIRMVRK